MSRTAKGTVKAKTSGATLTMADLSANTGDCLIVLLGFQQQNLPTSVKWGARELSKAASQINSTAGMGAGIYVLRNVLNEGTRDLVVTWASEIGARVMAVITLSVGYVRDEFATSVQTALAAPSVGPTSELSEYGEYGLGVLVSEGPSSDTAPSLSGSWTAGQRDGTLGAPPISNITLLEGYQQLGLKDAITISGTGVTARDWVSCVVAFQEIIEAPVLDKFGSEIMVDDKIRYKGSSYNVDSKISGRDALLLSDGNRIWAFETEVLN